MAELNENIEDIKKYTVENGDYIFHLRKVNEFGEEYFVEVKLPVTMVDGLFYDFSRFGNNMSGLEILRKYRLKPEVFAALKSRLVLSAAQATAMQFMTMVIHSASSAITSKLKGERLSLLCLPNRRFTES